MSALTREDAGLIALAGTPNSGKTALFNALTGSRQKVANYAGVTVERKEGLCRTGNGKWFRILDLPGAYSLKPHSPDEAITRDVLLGKIKEVEKPELLIAVADATNLERNLAFVLELLSLNRKVILALNMFDLAKKRGIELDLKILSQELGCPVIPTIAVKKDGVGELLKAIEGWGEDAPFLSSGIPELTPQDRFTRVDEILKRAVKNRGTPEVFTSKLDSFLLHPVFGTVTLLAILLVVFQAVFKGAEPLQEVIQTGFSIVSAWISQLLGPGPLQSLIVDGIVAGGGAVIVFLPQILILFAFILILEDFGYMARAAFLMDRIMGAVGLHGRAFIPLLSSFACAIPGIMATRTIESKRDRLATILIAPLMTCSARLPVYTLLISAFIPNRTVFGPFQLQGLVMLGLYVVGVVSAIAVAFLLKLFVLKGDRAPLLLELPTYKVPSLRNLFQGLYERTRLFLKRAGTVIVSLSVLLWFLASYPKPKSDLPEGISPITMSYAGIIGKSIEPLLRPIGFDWRMSVALIPGMAAREVMVSALSTVYAVESNSKSEEEQQSILKTKLIGSWSLATALSVLAWYIFAPQCLSTLAVTRRETNSQTWPVIMALYLFVLAYLASFVTYHIAVWLGGSA